MGVVRKSTSSCSAAEFSAVHRQLEMEINMNADIRYGFVPPGHQAIMAIQVLHAWPHITGAWLSLQAIGRDVALIWRSCDSWKATAFKVFEVSTYPTREENYAAAFRAGSFMVEEGPPPELLASAQRSAAARKEKASAAAQARWRKDAVRKSGPKPADIKKGPDIDAAVWSWAADSSDGAAQIWTLKNRQTRDAEFSCTSVGKDGWRLSRYWKSAKAANQAETLITKGSLEECFLTMESLSKRDIASWNAGEVI